MHIEKTVLEKLAVTLLEKAEECFDLSARQKDLACRQQELALVERNNADRKHALTVEYESNADKLAAVGHALEASAVAIKGDTLVVQREPNS